MVTRCALVLRLVRTPAGDAHALIRLGSASGDGERIELGNVAAAVERLTDAFVPSRETISVDDYISLTVKAPNVPDITLVDLPGIIYTSGGSSLARRGRCGALAASVPPRPPSHNPLTTPPPPPPAPHPTRRQGHAAL
jgi:hypothetical protein